MASRSGPSTRLLGVVSALGVVSGCGEDPCDGQRSFDAPPEPDANSSVPTVVAGEWIGAGVLELQFSQPVTSIGDLDTDRFAIVSWAAQVSDYGDACSMSTSYREPGGYYQSGVAEVWIGPEDDTLVRVRLNSTGAPCPTAGPNTVGSGVMLVYTDGAQGGPALLDENGDSVPAIGPGWAIGRIERCLGDTTYYYCGLNYYGRGHLSVIQSLAPIPCP